MTISLTLLACVAVVACSNPAKDKPEAEVREPAATPVIFMPRGADTGAPGAATLSQGRRFTVQPDSTIGFVGSKITGQHDGGFKSFTGEITLVGGDPEASSVHLMIDAKSLWADNPKLTNHLKSPDFFGVEQFPTAEFESNAIKKTAAGYDVSGDLTLHGVTKNITFPATINVGDDAITVQAEFVLKRFDFNIVYPGKPNDLIREEVVVKFDLKATAG